jgi:hypothetical protein
MRLVPSSSQRIWYYRLQLGRSPSLVVSPNGRRERSSDPGLSPKGPVVGQIVAMMHHKRASPRINKCIGPNQLATLDENDTAEFGGPGFTK